MKTVQAPAVDTPTLPTTAPTCLQVLTLLDGLADELNEPDDPGPTDQRLYPRSTAWCRALRRQWDDLEEQRLAFVVACKTLEMDEARLPELRTVLARAVSLLRGVPVEARLSLDLEACQPKAEAAWQRTPSQPLAGLRHATQGSDLRLRVAVTVDPALAAPWEDWSLQLWRQYRVGEALLRDFKPRREWDYEDVENGQWAKQALVRILRELDWLPPEAAMDERLASEDTVMMAVEVAERAAIQYVRRRPKDSPWAFDPCLWSWIPTQALNPACAKVGYMDRELGFFWVLQSNPDWPPEHDGLSSYIDLIMKKRAVPSRPAG